MRRSDHFKLGIFVLVGTFLFLVVVLVLGGGDLFRDRYRFETYMDEAVNGLSIGSPVKYRGVDVGSVTDIGFVTGRYVDFESSEHRYVYVAFEMDTDSFEGRNKAEMREGLADDITRGLRVRPISQGLTGQLFLSVDYLPPAANPLLPITWEPKRFYIPAAPSTLSRLEAAATSVADALDGLEKDVVARFMNALTNATESLGVFLETADAKDIGSLVQDNLNQTRQMFANINRLLSSPALEHIVPEVQHLLAGANELMDRSKEDVVKLLADAAVAAEGLAGATARLNELMDHPGVREGLDRLPESFAAANNAILEFEAATARFHDAMARINNLVADQQLTIREILESVRVMAQNLREFSEEAKRNPSGVLFGEPPQRVLPGE